MARLKNHLLVVIGFAVAGLIGAAFGTGTAQAIVSTLVTVVNPNTSPVQTNSVNVTDPGRIAYQSQLDTSLCAGLNGCLLTFPTVATGHRVVVQEITGFDGFSSSPTMFAVSISIGNSTEVATFSAPFSRFFYRFVQPALFYVDSGLAALVSVSSDAVFAGHGDVTLIGYELDCTVAACAPIATQ